VQILNSDVRHFQVGIYDNSSTVGSHLSVEDTIASDNSPTGIVVSPSGSGVVQATLNRITANNNDFGVAVEGNASAAIANSVMSNNSNSGLFGQGGVTWLAKSVISGNPTGVRVGGTVNSYGDNYINNNGTPVAGILTPVGMQ
jgi:hypothetical protein